MLINSTTQGSIYFVWPELDLPISIWWKPLKILLQKISQPSIDSCPTDNSHIVFPAPPLSTVLPDQIYFFPPERDKEMKINDKISSQSIKQNEQRTHGANQINLFLKSKNPFPALAPHVISCPPADYTTTPLFLFLVRRMYEAETG